MNTFYSISPIGEFYVPAEYRDAIFSRGSVKLFANEELARLDRIFTHIQRGGVAVVEGEWESITDLMEYIQRHKRELSGSNSNRKEKGKQRDHRNNPKQDREAAISRLMCWVNQEGILQVEPSPTLPYLLELIGEMPDANEDCPFLVPVSTLQRILTTLENDYPINALNASLVASENVLAPRSQETIECFQEALQSIKGTLTQIKKPMIADVGSGSGCLTLLAQQEFGAETEIYASDILPEAVATTKINVQHILPNAENVQIMPPGDLFDPFPSIQFDVIIFNAPWVVARVRNRSELAIHDEKQQTLQRFFEQVSSHLKPEGTVILGYADASGPKAIASLEAIIEESAFVCKDLYKRRVATHRSKRKWEHIQVYVLRRN